MLPNGPAFVTAYLALLEAGAVLVPLPTDLPAGDLLPRLAAGGIPFLLAGERQDGAADPLAELPGIGRLWRVDTESAPAPPDAVLRHYSSGSTGRPKAMYKSDAAVAHDAAHFCEGLGLGPDEVFLGVAPFCHAYGALSLLACLRVGGRLLAVPRFLPGALLELARRHQPTVLLATPPVIRLLATCRLEPGEEAAFRHLRHCLCSTDRLAAQDALAFRERYGVPVRVQYGSTETLSATVDLEDDFQEGLAGRPYPGVQVAIFDEEGAPLAPGRQGRVGVRSPSASSAYLDDPEATARTFRDGWVFPGDAGWLDEGGRLHLAGRADLLNVGGNKVDALEVEAVIRAALPVRVVRVVAGERAGLPAVRAIIEADPEVTRARVLEACRLRLPPHKVPAWVDIRPSLPRDAAGKIRLDLLDTDRP